MLQLKIPIGSEGFDEVTETFIEPETVILELEHSLVSLSTWESKWCKPFLSKKGHSDEELFDYIRCMVITPNVNLDVLNYLTPENVRQVNDYISSPMTATTISDNNNHKGRSEVVTSELIYYWMIALGIPFECERWHLNRLIMLIRVCNAKNEKPKKMSQTDIMRRNSALNAARRAKYNSKG